MYKDQFTPAMPGVYHGFMLVKVPNNMDLNILVESDTVRLPISYIEQTTVRQTDIIIARLLAV